MSNKNNKLSVFISLILRHKPETVGIKLDNKGYADVNEFIFGINQSGRKIDINTLREIVKDDNKTRYSFNEDRTKIRANQGHSVGVDVELKECQPPKILFHGTATRFLDSIMENGVNKGSRLYVHLSNDMETASRVGKRHGELALISIDAKSMHQHGYKFYVSRNGVWLVSFVPSKYIFKVER